MLTNSYQYIYIYEGIILTCLVCLHWLISGFFLILFRLEFCQITVIITFPGLQSSIASELHLPNSERAYGNCRKYNESLIACRSNSKSNSYKYHWWIKEQNLKCHHDLHLVIENTRFSSAGSWNQMLIDDAQDIITYFCQFFLYLLAIPFDQLNIVLIPFRFFFLFNGWHYAPWCSASPNDIFITNRQEVPLLNCQLQIELCNFLHGFNHFWFNTSSIHNKIIEQQPIFS